TDPPGSPNSQIGYGQGARTWTDLNGNYAPDCDLTNPLTNGECGPLPNPNRGRASTLTTFYDPAYLAGWNVRPYTWNSSVSVQHELRPGLGVNVGYFSTWNGNLTVTENRATPASLFDSYCVTAPTDSRLGSVSGQQVCGLFDVRANVTPNNLVTLASNYGSNM